MLPSSMTSLTQFNDMDVQVDTRPVPWLLLHSPGLSRIVLALVSELHCARVWLIGRGYLSAPGSLLHYCCMRQY